MTADALLKICNLLALLSEAKSSRRATLVAVFDLNFFRKEAEMVWPGRGNIVPDSSVTQRLTFLPNLSKVELCTLWRQLFKSTPPPKMRRQLLHRVIAYRLQEQHFGGLNNALVRRLRQIANILEGDPNATVSTRPPIKAGTRLVREWKQQIHTVEVDAEGYQYKGSHYESLSEIARLITGTRWSGPLFFGLKKAKQTKESMEVE
jgi:hypothetical protein